MTESSTPSWQHQPCPDWCTREHRETDIDSDRDHTGDPTVVPVLRLFGVDQRRAPIYEEASLEVNLRCGVAEAETVAVVEVWYADEGTPSLRLSPDSARLLAGALLEVAGQS